jgi:hypothetical protein
MNSSRSRRLRVVGAVGGLVAIIALLVSAFAGGGGRSQPGVAGAASAGTSCATFDQATGRLAAKDNKGFIDAMTTAASAAQTAAAANGQWQPLVSAFASFATDLAAHDAQKVFNDLDTINQLCAAVRGPRALNLKGP